MWLMTAWAGLASSVLDHVFVVDVTEGENPARLCLVDLVVGGLVDHSW